MTSRDTTLLVSPQNTGTRFLINFFSRLMNVVLMAEMRTIAEHGAMDIQFSGGDEIRSRDEGNVLISTHYYAKELDTSEETFFNFVFPWMCLHPTITPLRDPLAAILTLEHWIREKRTSATELTRHLFAWRTMVKVDELLGNRVFYAPLDLQETFAQRLMILNQLVAFSSRYEPEIVAEYAKAWPAVGSGGDYDLKRLYQDRDATAIEHEIPAAWKVLKDLQPTLRPFLEKHGYTDLLWWD